MITFSAPKSGNDMTWTVLHDCLDAFVGTTVAVVGDYCLDVELYADEYAKIDDRGDRICIQAANKQSAVGGAGNVAKHLLSLGATVYCFGLVGNDSDGDDICLHLARQKAVVTGLVQCEDRKTDCYLRIHTPNGAGSAPFDRACVEYAVANTTKTTHEQEARLCCLLEEKIGLLDGIIIADMHTEDTAGTLTRNVKDELSRLAGERLDLPFIVDSRHYLSHYRHMYLKCNTPEFICYTGCADINSACVPAKIIELLSGTSARGLFITAGENGIRYYRQQCDSTDGYGLSAKAIDACGAGDAATCGILLGLNTSLAISDVLFLGNLMGCCVVEQQGTGILCPERIREVYRRILTSS